MIIPPDTEKDPRLFESASASTSTPSLLLPPPSESDLQDGDAVRNVAYGRYPLGRDDLGVGYMDAGEREGEFLPPYERRARALAHAHSRGPSGDAAPPGTGAGRGASWPEMRERPGHMGITIPHRHAGYADTEGSLTPTTANPTGSASSSRLPPPALTHTDTLPSPATTLAGSCTAKLWESTLSAGSSSSLGKSCGKGKEKARAFLCLPTRLPWLHSSSSPTASLSTSTLNPDPADPPVSRRRRWWKKYRRIVICLLILVLIGVGLMIGLLAGLRQNYNFYKEDKTVASGPAWHDVEPGDVRWNMAWADGSMNLTWTQSRDAPPASDGALSQCNTFAPLNASDPSTNFTTLSVPYPSNRLWVSTYYIPLGRINTTAAPWAYIPPIENEEYQGNGKARNGSAPSLDDTSAVSSASAKKNTTLLGGNPAPARVWPANASAFPLGLLSQLPVHSRGLASSGTVELIGRDASEAVIQGGEEGSVRIDVVIQYGGLQAVEGIMRVCGTSNGDSLGVGVYTPITTDGKITNPYTLDPTQQPSFHIIIRFPPSLFTTTAGPGAGSDAARGPVFISDMLLRLDKMGLRIGDLSGIAKFGNVNITSNSGGAVVDYIAADRVWVQTAENAVRGRFNVSKSLYINSTDSSILTDVILHDPNSPINTTLPRSSFTTRGVPNNSTLGNWSDPHALSPSNLASSLTNTSSAIANQTHTVNTTFHTTDGFIRLRYLAHPPTTALSSWVSLSSGEMDVSLHPNYVGPFAVKNAWGLVRLPPPRERIYDDPLGQGRQRQVVRGTINIEDGSLFQRGGLNTSLLSQSGTTVTGAAYWQLGGANGTLSPQAVQASQEGKMGSRVMLLGGWGDITLRADGS